MTTTKKTSAGTRDGLEGAMKAGQESYARNFDHTVGAAREQLETAVASFLKSVDEAQGYGRANFDAVMKANAAAAKGVEELSRTWFALAQGTFEQSVSVTKALMGAKTIREVVDLQSDYAKTAFDSLVTEGTRLSELGAKVTNEAIAPLSERVNATVEDFAKSRAA